MQDQIATDEQGRRRFHGAFTGGFSAGYWNTVGSKEGWTPQSFKSSRTEKATENLTQKPEDFMDDEDRGEFGIAPRSVKITDDFSSVKDQKEDRKRKFLQSDMQPIPGEPVLHQLIKPVRDKAAVRILKTWGWRPGQGIGPRQTRKEKKKAKERNKKELYLMERYGCELPSTSNKNLLSSDDDEDDVTEDEEDEITFAPEDCELPPHYIKQNKYGIGYEPLSRQSVLGGLAIAKQTEHINLFQPLEAVGKHNQKISFAGQAFGVGAFEEDDDDVYAMDDMTRYDFSLENKKKKNIRKKANDVEELLFGEFVLDRNPPKLPVYKVEMPFGWHPRNWNEKRSRFEPLDPRKQRHLEKIFPSSTTESKMTREKRAELLGEELQKSSPMVVEEKPAEVKDVKVKTVEELQKEYKERKEKTKSLIERITAKSSNFTKGGIISMDGEEHSVSQAGNNFSSFKPFASNESKQKRYEQFLANEFKTEQEIEEFLKTIQPIELSLWDRQMELKEFQQAKKLYKPLKGVMSDR